jgi:hypothetical protein
VHWNEELDRRVTSFANAPSLDKRRGMLMATFIFIHPATLNEEALDANSKQSKDFSTQIQKVASFHAARQVPIL